MVTEQSRSASGRRSLSRSFSATKLFLRRQLWIWPVFAAVILAVVGWSVRSIVENAVKTSMADNLQTILNADVEALDIWLKSQEAYAQAVAVDPAVKELVGELLRIAGDGELVKTALAQSPEMVRLRGEMKPWVDARKYGGFVVVDAQGRVIAAQRDDPIGLDANLVQADLVAALFEDENGQGRATVTRPFKSKIVLGETAAEPTMFAMAPIHDAAGRAIAAVGLRIQPEADFTRILGIARAGETGETYAFDATGVLLSQSRFDEDLKEIGLLVDREEEKSILNIEIRDPQADMTLGERPKLRRPKQPLTRMAASAIQGNSEVDVEGYRDYRGVPVIGAWTWLSDYDFGVTSEVDVAEAYKPVYILRYTFWGLFALLAVSAVAIFVFTIIVSKLNRSARRAALQAQQLGQYSLEEQIGAGGMGVVYRGHHAMLQRPTAIKLLDVDKTTDEAIARFEREVQLTSRLNHPNTIAIYDYGRTPEGIFYYAMEYLDGITLDQLVKQHGAQPEGRTISILQQICGSLIEAHGVGLIHRDIKPANIILNRRGGMFDVVKLLDFGLVKAVDAEKQSSLTAAGAMTGTPLYLSPEGIERPGEVDVRSDLYAVGAVGYFLLTGQPLFDGQSVVEICMQQVNSEPVRPSDRLGKPVSEDLEAVLLGCLAKDPAARPQNAKDLLVALSECIAASSWTMSDAESWWEGTTDTPVTIHESMRDTTDDSPEAQTYIVDRGMPES